MFLKLADYYLNNNLCNKDNCPYIIVPEKIYHFGEDIYIL